VCEEKKENLKTKRRSTRC